MRRIVQAAPGYGSLRLFPGALLLFLPRPHGSHGVYVRQTIKRLPDKPEPVLLAKILNQVAGWGRFMPLNPPSAFRNWRRYCYRKNHAL